MDSIVFCAFCMLLGLVCAVSGQEPLQDSGAVLSNRVLVAVMPRRPMPEYITPDQVRALPWRGGEVVKNACLSCEKPDTELFPAGAKIVFVNCNLDNVLIPAGCKLANGHGKDVEQKRFVPCEVTIDGKVEVRNVLLEKGSTTKLANITTDGEAVTDPKIKEAVK